MVTAVSQEILDALTRVKLPGGVRLHETTESIEIRSLNCPVHRVEALVLGSGAAGLRAAVELKRQNVDQARTSDHAGFICNVEQISDALNDAKALNHEITSNGIHIESESKISAYFNWMHTALCSEAVLTALNYYAKHGGGSRGAWAMCSPTGTVVPQARNVDLGDFRFIEEQDRDKDTKIVLEYGDGSFDIHERKLRGMEDPQGIFFEKNWASNLTGSIYKKYFKHD